jgi:hypothetical protein
VMGDSAAAQFLIDTCHDDPQEVEHHDHRPAKEYRRHGISSNRAAPHADAA